MGDIKSLEECLAEMGWFMCIVPAAIAIGVAWLVQKVWPEDVQK